MRKIKCIRKKVSTDALLKRLSRLLKEQEKKYDFYADVAYKSGNYHNAAGFMVIRDGVYLGIQEAIKEVRACSGR